MGTDGIRRDIEQQHQQVLHPSSGEQVAGAGGRGRTALCCVIKELPQGRARGTESGRRAEV